MEKTVIALGFFDCVHLGHRKVINQCVHLAQKLDAIPALMTFDDDFLSVLGEKSPNLVYTLDERRELYQELGIEKICVLPSDEKTLSMTVDGFHEFLMGFNPIGIVVGEDFSYAKYASGNTHTLKNFCDERNIFLEILNFERFNGEKISSSSARNLISNGDVGLAGKIIGRDYFLDGVVVHGRSEGHLFNIPTANITVPSKKIIPADGVYATVTVVNGKTWLSATNIGTQPTFNCNNRTIETLIIDFSGDIYGKNVRVFFKEKLRDIHKYDKIEDLIQQIKEDIKRTKDKYGKCKN